MRRKRIEARLVRPAKAIDYANIINPMPWDRLPGVLKSRFGQHTPMYILRDDATVDWDGYRWTIKAGFIWDGASIPRSFILRCFGISRFTHAMELFPASLFHDAGWRGTAPRLAKGKLKNLFRWTDFYVALGVSGGYPAWRMRWQGRVLAASAFARAGRRMDYPDPTLVSVTPLSSNHVNKIDWLNNHTPGGA